MKYIFRSIFLLALCCLALTACDAGEVIPHEHTVESWQTVEAPTCTQTGLASGSCSVCRIPMDMILPTVSHTLSKTVVSPTCTEVGYTHYACDCGYEYDSDHTLPTGHSLAKTVTQPTCTKEGYTRYTCACGYKYDSDHTPPTGHSLTQTVIQPTCTTEGYTRYACACGYKYDSDHTPPTGHSLTQTVIQPTCTTEGYTHYTCACGYKYDGDHTPPTGHTLTKTVIQPTCTTEGYTHYTCACGYKYDSDLTPPTGHSFTKNMTRPTCTEEGYTRYTCGCGYTYDRDPVSATGHDLTPTVAVPPTCTEEGYTRYVCSACDHEEDGDPIPALNHANMETVVYTPTVLRDGYTLHTCTDCGYSYEDEKILYRDMVTGAYTDNTEILMQGIDTSKWNHEYGTSLEDIKPLDWEALKAAGVDFVILKAGSTKGIDPAFELDYRDAKAAGLQVGAYFYTYATTPEEILAEAELLLSWLEGKQFEFPIYLDVEDDTLMGLGGDVLTEMCATFVARLQEERYYAALYTNTEWLYNLLDTEWAVANLDIWYARYTSTPAEGEGFTLADEGFVWKDGTASKPGQTDQRFGVWQYTCYGVVEGFRYNFDLNYAFKDYASIMIQWGLNGFSPEVSIPETV